NNNWPGRVDHGGNLWAAAVCREPAAVRAVQLATSEGNYPQVLPENNAHFVANVLDVLLNAGHYQKALALPDTSYRLPMEAGQPDFAWADEQAGTVVVKEGDARLYVQLNWRRGFLPGGRGREFVRVNNRARVHFTTPTLDRIATVAMESPHGFGRLYLCHYGPYFIAMNLSEDTPYPVALPPGWERAVHLGTGTSPTLQGALRLEPGSTVVLRR
ncbi:MAG: hypothetical protein QHJ73_20080, partial [Armatimonadota bacterium]|nr:hypothetical protein [Armatimonadota bacterium]